MHKPNRNGLSALDVVVTIVILLILAALLLPSVRVSGGASRRSQCKNNLKQIGLSLMNYHDVHRTFPPGWIASETKGRSSGFGWGYQVLPYFDQKPLFEKFDAKRKLSDQTSGNDDLAKTILTAMRCPSDDGPDQAKSNWMPLLGTTNYVGNFGVGIPITYSVLDESKGNLVNPLDFQGILGPNSRIRIRDVKDGMSNVVLAGERRLSKDGTEWPLRRIEGPFNSYWAGIPNVGAVSPLAIVATATGGNFEGSIKDDTGNWSGLARVGNLKSLDTPDGREALPYFKINHDSRGEPRRRRSDGTTSVTAGFSSWHNGCAQFVLGDGSIRFLSENIDPTIFTNLMRRSDGATLGEF
jgi:type II secretory pathway pseudopilin PulG